MRVKQILFEEDISFSPHDTAAGEKKLLCAILERAIRDAMGKGERRHLALEWVLQENAEENVFSFQWITFHLWSIDPAPVRKAIINLVRGRKWKKKHKRL